MILVDYSQISISNLMMQPDLLKTLDENLIRHMIINSLRGLNVKYGKEYGELILCADDKNYWRKDAFPYYKAMRKKGRDASDLDWNKIFEILNRIRDELKENFPYKLIQVNKTEADDIIATFCLKYGVELKTASTEKILIVSSDKDFRQLQRFVNVEQYSPTTKKFIRESDPEKFLREHIIRGDTGDGIPNILSQDDSFVSGTRQKPVTEKKLNTWLTQDFESFCDETMLRNAKRNEMLIDLSKIPVEYQTKILETYETVPKNGRDKLMNYFIKNRMKQLMQHLQEF